MTPEEFESLDGMTHEQLESIPENHARSVMAGGTIYRDLTTRTSWFVGRANGVVMKSKLKNDYSKFQDLKVIKSY